MYCSAQKDVVEVQEMQQNLPWVSCLGQCNNAWMLGRLSVRSGVLGGHQLRCPSDPNTISPLPWRRSVHWSGPIIRLRVDDWRKISGLLHICFSQLLSWTLGGVMVKELSICHLSKGFRENPCPSVKTSECGPIAKHCAYTAKPSEAWRRYRSSWTEVEHRSGQCLCATEFCAHRSLYLFSL